MSRASEGRACRIVISSMTVIVPGFAGCGESNRAGRSRASAIRCCVVYRAGASYGMQIMVTYSVSCVSCLILLVLLMPIASWAADAKKPRPAAVSPSERLGAADSWTAFDFREKSGKVCYVVGEPEKSEPVSARRKPPVAMVTHRPGEKVADVVSFDEGYPLKDGSD